MTSYNRHIVLGFVGSMPELKQTKTGQSVCKLSVATTDKFKTPAGDTKTATEWHQVVFWGKQAELAVRFLRKGSLVLIEGKHKYHTYTDKRGSQIRQGEIFVEQFKKLRKDDGADDMTKDLPDSDDAEYQMPEFSPEVPF